MKVELLGRHKIDTSLKNILKNSGAGDSELTNAVIVFCFFFNKSNAPYDFTSSGSNKKQGLPKRRQNNNKNLAESNVLDPNDVIFDNGEGETSI